MIRCKPLLGTFVEIVDDGDHASSTIPQAFLAIEQVQSLMGFHNPHSELSKINQLAHIKPIHLHPWTSQVLAIAKEIHQHSDGVFNCGIGHHLVEAGLLPKHTDFDRHKFGSLDSLHFVDTNTVYSDLPICLDLGGIAKGFAVDMAIQTMQSAGAKSGCVNAGGDLRVFGNLLRPIQIRNPAQPHELIHIGDMCEGAIATSALYYLKEEPHPLSYLIDPILQNPIEFSDSYSVIAQECVYADALTKVVSISANVDHPCLHRFSAQAIRIPNK